MKITMTPEIALRLMTIGNLTEGMEFSGLGFCRREQDQIVVYDVALMDIGSEVFTEIPSDLILPLLDRSDAGNLKVWVHKHPLGTGVPGNQNWSGMDQQTIKETPLGGVPEMVKWSASMVLTPGGWVGRLDNHLTQKTLHCEVEPQASEAYGIVRAIADRISKQVSFRRRRTYRTYDFSRTHDFEGMGTDEGERIPFEELAEQAADIAEGYTEIELVRLGYNYDELVAEFIEWLKAGFSVAEIEAEFDPEAQEEPEGLEFERTLNGFGGVR